jgi:uridine kinase
VDRSVRSFAELAARVHATPGPVRLVGVDGGGAAGKTTFAQRLARSLGDVPVVHTDDFASHDEPMQWWPGFLEQVVDPLLAGRPATFRPYDWTARRRRSDPTVVAVAPAVVIEGVGAMRAAWRDRLALRVWVEAPRALRLERGVARDGEALLGFWQQWQRDEDAYFTAEQPAVHADLVVDGAPALAHDPERQYVELRTPSP